MITNKLTRHISQEEFFLIILLVCTFFAGLFVRVSLAFTLPIWLDERVGIEVSNNSFYDILSGKPDPTHLPTYYLISKLTLFIPNSNIFLRLISLLFYCINVILINKIGTKTLNKKFGIFASIAYSLSGYFFIFDWQARMYTPLVFLILVSLYAIITKVNPKFLFLINLFGVFFDYGFLYYLLPLITINFWILLSKERTKLIFHYFLACFVPLLLFLLFWYFNYSTLLDTALNNTDWNRSFANLTFFIKYASGIHNNLIFAPLFFILFLLGIRKIFKGTNQKLLYITLPGLFSVLGTIVAKLVIPQLLHVRMLQIAGLSLLFTIAIGIEELYSKNKYIAYIVIFILVIGLYVNYSNLILKPGYYLISF